MPGGTEISNNAAPAPGGGNGATTTEPPAMADIHPTAIIGERVRLGAGVCIGPGVIIEDDVDIGAGTRAGAYSFIGRRTRIGPDNAIGMWVQVGGDPQIVGWQPADSRVVVGAGNVFREYVSIHRAKDAGGETVIGDGCYLMGGAHVAHDCRLGNHVVLANGALLAGHVEVGDHAFVSGNCVVHQFVRIGRRVMIRGMTALGKDAVPFVLIDQSNTVRSLNKVGLRREGLQPAVIREVDRAFRELFRSKRPVFQSLEILERGPMCDEVEEMVRFIRASKRGICLWYSTQVRRLEEGAPGGSDDD